MATLLTGGLVAAGFVLLRPASEGAVLAHAAQGAASGPLVPGAFNARTFVDGGTAYRYQLFVPRGFDRAHAWPVVVALHGGHEKGTDGVKPIEAGLGPVLRDQAATFPAVVLFPQVPPGEPRQRFLGAFQRMVDTVLRDVNGDPRRLYLTGYSFGGGIAYDLARERPERWAALVPISTNVILFGPDGARASDERAAAAEASALRDVPVWIFHGARDGQFPIALPRQVVATMKRAGVAVRYTEIADAGHDAWERAYRMPELWSWVFAQHR
jgi:predicted peptidase